MGRYKDYDRGPKRGGPDEDQKSDDRASEVRPNYPRPNAPAERRPPTRGSGLSGGQDGGGQDVFVHATTLARAGLSGLAEGQRVRMQIGQGQKGLEAQTIKLLD
jgi:cold shock CspA family protein